MLEIEYCFDERIINEVYISFEWNSRVHVDYISEEKVLFIYNAHKKYIDMAKEHINSIGFEIESIIR